MKPMKINPTRVFLLQPGDRITYEVQVGDGHGEDHRPFLPGMLIYGTVQCSKDQPISGPREIVIRWDYSNQDEEIPVDQFLIGYRPDKPAKGNKMRHHNTEKLDRDVEDDDEGTEYRTFTDLEIQGMKNPLEMGVSREEILISLHSRLQRVEGTFKRWCEKQQHKKRKKVEKKLRKKEKKNKLTTWPFSEIRELIQDRIYNCEITFDSNSTHFTYTLTEEDIEDYELSLKLIGRKFVCYPEITISQIEEFVEESDNVD